MKTLCVLLLLAAVARAEEPPFTPVNATLTSIDELATSRDFDIVFDGSGSAVSGLATLASTAADVGVQLRAIRGLSQYPGNGSIPHDTLLQIIDAHANVHTGSDVLILRAAIESLGALDAGGHAQPEDAARLLGHLNDASRDVRATTARALGELCDTSAINPLRARFQVEGTGQVRLAISEALRVLGTCTSS